MQSPFKPFNRSVTPASDRRGAGVVQYLMLSLFLLLLAFFIALTANANFDDTKTVSVLASLEEVFPVKHLRGQGAPSMNDAASRGTDAGAALSRIEGLFKSDVFPFSVMARQNEGTLVVAVSSKTMFDIINPANSAVLTPVQRQSFLAALARLLNPAKNHSGIVMAIEIYTDQSPARLAAENPDRLNAVVNRAEDIVIGLVDGGLPPERMVTGIREGQEESIRLVFYEDQPGGIK